VIGLIFGWAALWITGLTHTPTVTEEEVNGMPSSSTGLRELIFPCGRQESIRHTCPGQGHELSSLSLTSRRASQPLDQKVAFALQLLTKFSELTDGCGEPSDKILEIAAIEQSICCGAGGQIGFNHERMNPVLEIFVHCNDRC
jgi:hypothetical protein